MVAVVAIIFVALLVVCLGLGISALRKGSVPAWAILRRNYQVTPVVARLYGWSFLLLGIGGLIMAVASLGSFLGGSWDGLSGILMPFAGVTVLVSVFFLFYATWRRDPALPLQNLGGPASANPPRRLS